MDFNFRSVETEDNTSGSKIDDTTEVITIAELLGIDVNDLILAMCTSNVAARGEVICR